VLLVQNSERISLSLIHFLCLCRKGFEDSKPKSQWNRTSLEDCLKDWLADKAVKKYQGMPSFLVSSIWWDRNSSIFRDTAIPPEITADIVLRLSNEFMMDLKVKGPRLPTMPEVDFEVPWGFFDGACQGHPHVCGVGIVLYLSHNYYRHIRYAPKNGTNNRDEFSALRTLLEISVMKKSEEATGHGRLQNRC
jgi:hypothetical protein